MLFAVMLSVAAMVAATPSLAADPSLHEVYQAVAAGNIKDAQRMMDKVLQDHPNSAKAHYVEAEIMAKDGQLDRARSELAIAEGTAPGLPFAKAASVDALKARLATPQARMLPVAGGAQAAFAAAPAGQMPWGMLLMALALFGAVIFFFRALNRPRAAPTGAGYLAGGNGFGTGGYAQPAGPGGPMGPAVGGGMGSGILGGLATGAAVGAGMVAGEALMHRMFGGSGGSQSSGAPFDAAPLGDPLAVADSGYDAGGNDFGVSDGGSWDDGAGGAGGGSDDWS
jgi:hypothetical protein